MCRRQLDQYIQLNDEVMINKNKNKNRDPSQPNDSPPRKKIRLDSSSTTNPSTAEEIKESNNERSATESISMNSNTSNTTSNPSSNSNNTTTSNKGNPIGNKNQTPMATHSEVKSMLMPGANARKENKLEMKGVVLDLAESFGPLSTNYPDLTLLYVLLICTLFIPLILLLFSL